VSELKSILLHVDAAANGNARLQLALRLARAYGARVDALYAVLPVVLQYPFAFAGDVPGAALLMNYETEQRERIKAAFENVRQRTAAADAPAVNWYETADEPVHAFTQRAWGADLMLLAQHDPAPNAYSGVTPDFAASVLVASGKPGVVMPFIGAGDTLGETVLIAWKPSPEAARAVTAALPLLQRAKRVHLALWDEGEQAASDAPQPIERYLADHGIAPKLHRNTLAGSEAHAVGELLLSLAADVQADLLVMGCYSHGRAREWVLGGATRTVLQAMTLPVFMVH
jgi:nucleotide-binding universal stress UspA family protein